MLFKIVSYSVIKIERAYIETMNEERGMNSYNRVEIRVAKDGISFTSISLYAKLFLRIQKYLIMTKLA